MKFRTVILAAVLALIVVMTGVAVVTVVTTLERNARTELREDLDRSAAVFEDLQRYRASLFDSEARMTAQEPRVKAVIAAEDVSQATVLDVAEELAQTLQSDLLLFTDGRGTLIADTADPEATGFDMRNLPVIAEALEDGKSNGIWTSEDGVTQVHAQSLAFGTTTVGLLVVGHHLDDRVVRTVQRQTGSGAAIVFDGVVIAASPLPGHDDEPLPDLSAALDQIALGKQVEFTLDGTTYVAFSAPMPAYAGEKPLDYVVYRSLDEALATSRDLATRLGLIALVGLLAGAAIAVAVSGRLARPVDDLVGFARKIGEGDLERRAEVAGPVELRALGRAMNDMVGELAESRAQLAAKQRLERELEIAERIQTSILPATLEVANLEIAARMVPADEVGGDYYDVIPTDDGCWIGIGDVAGHGLSAGLVMLMVQSATHVLAKALPDAAPSTLVEKVNRALFENVRRRLDQDEHVTFTLLRFYPDGRFVYAGAHEEMVICRRDGTIETVQTPGTWIGARKNIARALEDREMKLEPGDLLVLYTDGIIEAQNTEGQMFELERLTAEVGAHHEAASLEILDAVFTRVDTWSPVYEDDRTALVLRYRG